VVDIARLRAVLVPARPHKSGNSAALTSVPRSIALIKFLRQFPEFRA
jgi:hypothetical protein